MAHAQILPGRQPLYLGGVDIQQRVRRFNDAIEEGRSTAENLNLHNGPYLPGGGPTPNSCLGFNLGGRGAYPVSTRLKVGKLGSDVAVNLNGGGGDDEGICILMRGSGRESGCRFRG